MDSDQHWDWVVVTVAVSGVAAGLDGSTIKVLPELLHAVQILPMENTRGRDLLEKEGRLCERKNGRGVDPNRNWEVDWGKKEKDYDPNEEYPGTKPFR